MRHALFSLLLLPLGLAAAIQSKDAPVEDKMMEVKDSLKGMNTAPSALPSETESEKFSGTLRAKDAYPLGPYVDGRYRQSVGEEKQAEEERLIEDEGDYRSRINRMGPNKR